MFKAFIYRVIDMTWNTLSNIKKVVPEAIINDMVNAEI